MQTSTMEQAPARASFSTRTLLHPSFMALCSPAGLHDTRPCVAPMIPEEVFYTDPIMTQGTRILNTISKWKDSGGFRLNTPTPVMSHCPAPPITPDPFRSGHHPVRELGCPTWVQHSRHVPQNQLIIQLTQEEDLVITSLLALRYQYDETPASPQTEPPNPSESHVTSPNLHGEAASAETAGLVNDFEQDRHGSQPEEAQSLLSGFNHTEDLRIQSLWTGSSDREGPEPGSCVTVSPHSRSCVFLEVKDALREFRLSDSEREAVHVLLTLDGV
ncbi:uncharacterized protein LOC128756569 [Synchiropus splendidus]|uniref:uncharacterized protein LOC128756569 n=1 Tax=Synchiropus splendidus TaxID=270530 RepID=UPI00237E8F52|nr:uncharacterized protein LOC128756569 [Synchiropus splendidus]